MGSRGAFVKSGMHGIALAYREYSVVGYIDGIKVIRHDTKKNNPTPVYSNSPDTVYYSYSTNSGQIERILFYKKHRLVYSIDLEKGGNPAHAHKWGGSGQMIGRNRHDPDNVFKLTVSDMRYYKLAKEWNKEHETK